MNKTIKMELFTCDAFCKDENNGQQVPSLPDPVNPK
jgi:hypothetical protein